MGGRRDGDGEAGRPPVHPGPDRLTVDALLAAVRPPSLDPEAEARALAAFRDVREARRDMRSLRTRRRDDWRPRTRRRAERALPTLLAVLLGGATLGGVAVASIGDPPHETAPRRPARSEAPASPGAREPGSSTGPRRGSGPTSGSGATSGTGVTSGTDTTGSADRGRNRRVHQKPDKSAVKAAGKAAEARRKADEKAGRTADKAGRTADKSARAADRAARTADKAAGKSARNVVNGPENDGKSEPGKKK
jgi:hypothetical protein